jgi:hypothetical protein
MRGDDGELGTTLELGPGGGEWLSITRPHHPPDQPPTPGSFARASKPVAPNARRGSPGTARVSDPGGSPPRAGDQAGMSTGLSSHRVTSWDSVQSPRLDDLLGSPTRCLPRAPPAVRRSRIRTPPGEVFSQSRDCGNPMGIRPGVGWGGPTTCSPARQPPPGRHFARQLLAKRGSISHDSVERCITVCLTVLQSPDSGVVHPVPHPSEFLSRFPCPTQLPVHLLLCWRRASRIPGRHPAPSG